MYEGEGRATVWLIPVKKTRAVCDMALDMADKDAGGADLLY